MNKAEAEKEVLRLWRALPVMERQTLEQAVAFAATLHEEVLFETLGNRPKVIEGWLVRDILRLQEVLNRTGRPKKE